MNALSVGDKVRSVSNMKYPEIKALATKFRNTPTPAEELLWRYLRRKQLKGRKFLRQHPVIYQSLVNEFGFYIPDFYCAFEKLVVELDGKIHELRKEKDAFRDSILNHFGLNVLRFKNEELGDIDKVLNIIMLHFKESV
jgi:very-short-patch-repair endonuclease